VNPNRNRSKVTRTLPETQDLASLPGVLAEIVRTKRAALGALHDRASELESALVHAPPVRDFRAAISYPGEVALIAECKRRSPGAGLIRPDLDPVQLTRSYEMSGAAAFSVLTDEPYFGGSNGDLVQIRSGTSTPILRKDFTLDALHVMEARTIGADAVLLIVRILSDDALRSLLQHTEQLGMHALVETHDAYDLDRALAAGAKIIGINNRDLATFKTDLDTTLQLLEQVSGDAVVVSESGIRDAADVSRLGEAGVDAILVGETLLRAEDPGAAAAELSGIARVERVHA
jgi:indole-3-glycerol phosphate synthase